jgi:hypothetical protein
LRGSEFGAWGLGCKVQGLGFAYHGSAFGAWASGFKVENVRLRSERTGDTTAVRFGDRAQGVSKFSFFYSSRLVSVCVLDDGTGEVPREIAFRRRESRAPSLHLPRATCNTPSPRLCPQKTKGTPLHPPPRRKPQSRQSCRCPCPGAALRRRRVLCPLRTDLPAAVGPGHLPLPPLGGSCGGARRTWRAAAHR